MQHLQLTVGNIRELLSLQCLDDGKHAKQVPHSLTALRSVGAAHVNPACHTDPFVYLDRKHINFDSS